VLQNDINTSGHTQWFYFKIVSKFSTEDSVARRTVKFDILNLQKKRSLYEQGMRILVLDCNKEDPVWERGGT